MRIDEWGRDGDVGNKGVGWVVKVNLDESSRENQIERRKR